MNSKEFIESRKIALELLDDALIENKVDKDILPILNLLNDTSQYYTTSSCSGRIVLLEIPRIGDKKSAKFLGKWHDTIETSDVMKAIKSANKGLLWILAQSPIIHIVTNSFENADKLLKTAISSGFKNSAIKTVSKKIVIEVCSTERVDVPIGKDGLFFCDENYINLIVDISNDILRKSKEKLNRFIINLKKLYK